MMLKTFKLGGVHPAENKFSADKSIEVLPLPKSVTIPVSQHIGAPATVVVAKGDMVKVGTLIAKSSGFVSTNIHSSVSGKVSKIDEVMDASGYKKSSVVIEVDGDEWEETIDRSPALVTQCLFDAKTINLKILEAGIVGLGGATFPTHIKLAPPPGSKAEILIINGVECEPYLTCDHQLMLEKGEEIIVGITIIMKVLDVKRAVIGIENNKPDAIAHLSKIASQYKGIEVVALKVQYPQGGEKQLIDAVIGRQVPSGALPIEVGAVVQNVGTTFAIYEAVQKNKPLIERVMTVTGKSATQPSNYRVRIGTLLSEVVTLAGGVPEGTGKIIGGGPMMGRSLMNLNVPMAKGSAGILFMPDEESVRKPMKNCIRCTKCVSVCPMGLEPFLLMNQSERNMWPEMEKERVMDCIECGSCSYTCPSNRPLLDYIRYGKTTVGGIIRSRAVKK